MSVMMHCQRKQIEWTGVTRPMKGEKSAWCDCLLYRLISAIDLLRFNEIIIYQVQDPMQGCLSAKRRRFAMKVGILVAASRSSLRLSRCSNWPMNKRMRPDTTYRVPFA